MDEKAQKLLAEMLHGARLAFSNAEQLCREGEVLAKEGCFPRALFLHQISLEECAKVDMIGTWATNLLVGGGVDVERMAKAFRSHEAKNYSNAYMAAATQDEKEARKRGDNQAAVEAFQSLQKQFHKDSNTAKNAALYVDFRDSGFVAPTDVITKEAARGTWAVNVYFLDLTAPKIRLLERMQNDPGALGTTAKWFIDKSEALRKLKADEMDSALAELMQEMVKRHIEGQSQAGKK